MGKRQHQKDKMYLTCTEWSQFYGGKRPDSENSSRSGFRRLPFDHCALSLQPFDHPFCTPDGVIYDLMSIVPFLKKYGIDPATGKPLSASSLVKLNFHKNADGKYHCPVMYKVFTNNSHIVAIKTTGNVFSYEAVEQLNLKAKSFKDLLTDEPFAKTDIIVLQDPQNLDKFNFADFHHIKNNLKVEDEDASKTSGTYNLRSINTETRDILEELDREYKPSEAKAVESKKADKFNAAHYSTGAVAAGFTSTVMEPTTSHEAAMLDDEVVRYSRVKKKGYVRIETNMGQINLELHCDQTPKTCENFILLCERGYYNGVKFHRLIKNFVIQGGDPTGTGKGGESAWGKPFKDEFRPNLSHQGRGILSMANDGANANKSQFFITFRSCKHLDNKHTIFGRVVGGLQTLNVLEQIETDANDVPVEEIKILKATVFVNPFQEADELLAKERAKEQERDAQNEVLKQKPKKTDSDKPKAYGSGVGKYINPKTTAVLSNVDDTPAPKKKKVVSSFGDFSSW